MTSQLPAMPIVMIGGNVRALALAEVLDPALAWSPTATEATTSLQETLAEPALVVLCLDDYDGLTDMLDRHDKLLAGHDVVNLTSGTSAEAQAAAARFGAMSAKYLDGALMAHPEHVGDPETVLVYSGSAEVFQRNESVLARLGAATYLGPDAGTAALYDVAMLNFAWATLVGYLQTATILSTAEVRAESFTPMLTRWLSGTVVDVIKGYATQLDRGDYPGDEEWLELDYPLMRHLVQASEERGVDTRLPRLIESLTADGIAAGHGRKSFASLTEVMRHG